MKRFFVSAASIVVLASAMASGQSQTVRIAFNDGKVTLAANDALVSDVLKAWAEVGGTVITGVETLQASRITVEFTAESELTVLDELLGSTGGYLTGMRSEVPPGSSLLRMIQIGKRSKETRAAKAPPVIDMSIPESRFQYADPSPPDFPDPRDTADEMPQPAAPPGPQIMPEMRFQYAETPMPPPPEVPADPPQDQPPDKPQDKPAADPNTAPKKKPPQGP